MSTPRAGGSGRSDIEFSSADVEDAGERRRVLERSHLGPARRRSVTLLVCLGVTGTVNFEMVESAAVRGVGVGEERPCRVADVEPEAADTAPDVKSPERLERAKAESGG